MTDLARNNGEFEYLLLRKMAPVVLFLLLVIDGAFLTGLFPRYADSHFNELLANALRPIVFVSPGAIAICLWVIIFIKNRPVRPALWAYIIARSLIGAACVLAFIYWIS